MTKDEFGAICKRFGLELWDQNDLIYVIPTNKYYWVHYYDESSFYISNPDYDRRIILSDLETFPAISRAAMYLWRKFNENENSAISNFIKEMEL